MSLIKMIKPAGSSIPFRLLKEGRGGLVYFYQDSCPTRPSNPNDQTFTHQVGTYNATTSTGVYFALKLRTLRPLVRPVYEAKGIPPRAVASGLQTATDAVAAPEG